MAEDNLITLGDLDFWRKRSREFISKPTGECQHRALEADDEGEILTCKTCGKQVSAYWAFMRFMKEYKIYKEKLENKAKELHAREEKGLRLKAAQKIEEAWRSRTMVPACPHCRKAIMPGDGFGGLMYNKADPEGAEKSFKQTIVYLE